MLREVRPLPEAMRARKEGADVLLDEMVDLGLDVHPDVAFLGREARRPRDSKSRRSEDALEHSPTPSVLPPTVGVGTDVTISPERRVGHVAPLERTEGQER